MGLINTASQQSIFGELLQAATLTPDELLRCQSRGELEQYITEKISQKAQEFTTTNLDRTHIAQEMEHQAFLSNRW
ncbi:MAG: hypothetical protein Q8O99_01715 [bacterium]|nr:hypothetical protein [bacterium]